MVLMATETVYEFSMQVRTATAPKYAIDHAVARLRAMPGVRFRGRKVSQEAVINAAFLMLADMDDAELEETMGHYVGALEELLRGDQAEARVQHQPDDKPRVVAMQDTTEALRREIREKSKPKKVGPKKKGGK